MLNAVEAFIRRFCVLPNEHAYTTVTLWAAHCHALDSFNTTPRIAFMSGDPGSGKTTALTILQPITPRARRVSRISAPVLFGIIRQPAGLPTILQDEIDLVLGKNGNSADAGSIMDIWHVGYARGATSPHNVQMPNGRGWEIRDDLAFCPIAFAGLRYLPQATADRTIIIRMRKPLGTDLYEEYEEEYETDETTRLYDLMATWALDNFATLKAFRLDRNDPIRGRQSQIWRPLLAVANSAGKGGAKRARAAADHFIRDGKDETFSEGQLLLRDIHELWADQSLFMAT